MADPVYVSSAIAEGAATTSLVVNKPGSAVDGDQLLVGLVMDSAVASITRPSGWGRQFFENAHGGIQDGFYDHVVASGDPSSWTWTFSGAVNALALVAHYRNVTFVAPQERLGGNGTTVVAPADTNQDLAGPYTLIVHMFLADVGSGVTLDPEVALTSLLVHASGTSGFAATLAEFVEPAALVSTDKDATYSSGSASEHVGAQFGLQPPVGPTVPFPLRLFPRNDDLDGPRLPQFHDSAERSARLGGTTYE